jgi:hypothetical protein
METLVQPVLSVKYEIARQIILGLLKKGLISKAEFKAIDAENRKSFLPEHP